MATFHALLVGGGLFTLALVIMSARCVRITPRLLAALLFALLTSAGSALYATSGHAGTGTQVSRGFPRPFHFQRAGFEGRGESRHLNYVFFAGNSIVHFGALSLIAALLPRGRAERSAPTMPADMLVVRIGLGIFFLILALIGGIVPILQGWIFFLLALLVFFPKAKFTEKVLQKAQPKVPRVVALLRRIGIGQE